MRKEELHWSRSFGGLTRGLGRGAGGLAAFPVGGREGVTVGGKVFVTSFGAWSAASWWRHITERQGGMLTVGV